MKANKLSLVLLMFVFMFGIFAMPNVFADVFVEGVPSEINMDMNSTQNINLLFSTDEEKADVYVELIGFSDSEGDSIINKINLTPSEFTITNSTTQNVVMSIDIDNEKAGNYSGTLRYTYGVCLFKKVLYDEEEGKIELCEKWINKKIETKEITVNINENKIIDVDAEQIIEVEQGSTYIETITLTNLGNVDMNINIDKTSFEYGYYDFPDENIILSETNFELKIGETKEVEMTVIADEDQRSGTYEGSLTFKVDGVVQEMPMTIRIVSDEPQMLEITDLDIDAQEENWDNLEDGDKIDQIRPGDELEIQMEIENLFDEDYDDGEIEDIEATVTIKDIDDGDDLELEFDDFDLDQEDSETLEGTIEIPYEVDEGTYTMYIDVEGEDQDGNKHEIHWIIYVEVEKENEAIIISDIDLLRDTLACDRYTTLDVEVMNIGQDDLEDITVEVESSALGIDEVWNLDELESGSWDDDISDSHTFNILLDDSVPNGIYTLTIKVYYDDGDEFGDEDAITLTVESCGTTNDDDNDNNYTPSYPEDNDEEKIVVVYDNEGDYTSVNSKTHSTWPIMDEPWFMPLMITLVALTGIGVIIEIWYFFK